MIIYPPHLAEQLDFLYLKELLAQFCSNTRARDFCLDITPNHDFEFVQSRLLETNEYLLALHKGDPIQTSRLPELDKELHLLEIDNSVLNAKQFVAIRQMVILANDMLRFFEDKEEIYPALKVRIDQMSREDQLQKMIDEIIDKEGVLLDTASPLLASIRSEMQSNRRQCDRIYRAHIQRLNKLGHLADFEESFINGRRVLGLLAEYKRETKGIILGQSASGKITFIEPQNVIELNNDRLVLEEDEKKEIYRILKDLTDCIRPFHSILVVYYEVLVEMDFIYAKAKLAKELNATMPRLVTSGSLIHLVNAFHPVLWLQNLEKKIPTEPIHCMLSETERIMVISGPNAGGKSITLKTIGLLQIMLQCGLLIPASARSEMSLKHSILGDIGDNQSIEDGLSTYSSRLQKMKYFLEKADGDTLFLIDEFGTGSDPDMGGALAEVILHKLNEVKAQGVVTTHFTNLKILATQQEGIFNACMLFNSKTLKPLYQLQIGEPGSSFTFEVAEKIGLPGVFIEEAKLKLSREKVQMDKLLNGLQKEKNVLAKLKKDLQKQLSKTTAEKREYQQMAEKMEDEFIRNLKDREEKKKLMEFGKRLLQLTDEWMNNKNKKEIIDKFVKLAGYELHKKRAQEEYEKTEKYKVTKLAKIKPKVAEGSKVRLLKSREIGIIKEIKEDRANVLIGNIMMNIGLEKLELV